MDATEAALYVGHVFGGRYQALAHRASGNFSGVFVARDLHSGDDVALKLLSGMARNAVAMLEFEGELALLRALGGCTNVVDVLDSGEEPIEVTVSIGGGGSSKMSLPVRYIVLELADASLDELLVSNHELSWLDRCSLFRQIVKGVHQMHLQRIAHRDVKCDNTLLFSSGGETVAKISDLGRSRDCTKPARFSLASYESGRGDYRFAPPELLWQLGTESPLAFMQADLYHLGSVLFELGTAVGITSFSLGDFRPILAHTTRLGSEDARRTDFYGRIGELRAQYELAYTAFSAITPRRVRGELDPLLRQLTDVDPERRLPRIPAGSRLPRAWDLQWLLRRIDIAIKLLQIDARRAGGSGGKR